MCSESRRSLREYFPKYNFAYRDDNPTASPPFDGGEASAIRKALRPKAHGDEVCLSWQERATPGMGLGNALNPETVAAFSAVAFQAVPARILSETE
jgi:hypothetical protein